MRREELKTQVQNLIERIKSLENFQLSATAQQKTVLNIEKYEAEITDFLKIVDLLPEEHDPLLEGHYDFLARQLAQYKETMQAKEVYCKDIAQLKTQKEK